MTTTHKGEQKHVADKDRHIRQKPLPARPPIRAYTHQELAALYDISWKTMAKWIKRHKEKIGRKDGHFYSPKQVENIFIACGWPNEETTQRDSLR